MTDKAKRKQKPKHNTRWIELSNETHTWLTNILPNRWLIDFVGFWVMWLLIVLFTFIALPIVATSGAFGREVSIGLLIILLLLGGIIGSVGAAFRVFAILHARKGISGLHFTALMSSWGMYGALTFFALFAFGGYLPSDAPPLLVFIYRFIPVILFAAPLVILGALGYRAIVSPFDSGL